MKLRDTAYMGHSDRVQLFYDIWAYRQLAETGHDVTFQWLSCYCGIMGNEHIEEAARTAHEDMACRNSSRCQEQMQQQSFAYPRVM